VARKERSGDLRHGCHCGEGEERGLDDGRHVDGWCDVFEGVVFSVAKTAFAVRLKSCVVA